MGQTTQYLGIYIPAAGESNYDQAFSQGMFNIDNHDHTGGPNKGKPITTTALGDGSVTYAKLNTNVADATTGIQAGAGALANQLQLIGILPNIFTLGNAAPVGFIVKDSAVSPTAVLRSMAGTTNQIAVTNGDGAAGNPTFALSPTVLNTTQPSFMVRKGSSQNINNTGLPIQVVFDRGFGTQSFQQGGTNYSTGTSLFTAPIDGIYLFGANVEIGAVVLGDITVEFNVTAFAGGTKTYLISRLNANPIKTIAASNYSFSGTQLLRLATGDTVQVDITNETSGTIVAIGSAGETRNTNFFGALLY